MYAPSLLQAQSSTPARPLFSMHELKNRTSPDENSVAADLARKANAKATKVKEEEIESHAGECLVGSVGAMEVRGHV